MDLYKELLAVILSNAECTVSFSGISPNVDKIIHDRCYQTLSVIKEVLEDDRLDDKDCFMKIEEIV